MGYRGLTYFDLFFKERDWWKEICITDIENPVYQSILEERKAMKVLAISPEAFFAFHDLEVFKDRVLILDEAEQLAEKIIHIPTINYTLEPFLNHEEEAVANKAHFFVTRFCKEYIEPKLEHKITPFPQKILLNEQGDFDSFAEEIAELENTDANKFVVENLKNPAPKMVRFIQYFPEKGNLIFSFWEPDKWQNLKTVLSKFKKIICHRVDIEGDQMPFYRIFLGITNGEFYQDKALFADNKLIVPRDLISQNSPEFNLFTANKITEITNHEKNNVVTYFSSIETLRKVYDTLSTTLDESISLIGERVNGGNEKVLQLIEKQKNKSLCFCFKQLQDPQLETYNFKTLIIQKFPFLPPHPLMEKIESVMKKSGYNFFDLWVCNQVAVNLSRSASCFKTTEKIYFLDPRENTPWGKKILKKAFNAY